MSKGSDDNRSPDREKRRTNHDKIDWSKKPCKCGGSPHKMSCEEKKKCGKMKEQ